MRRIGVVETAIAAGALVVAGTVYTYRDKLPSIKSRDKAAPAATSTPQAGVTPSEAKPQSVYGEAPNTTRHVDSNILVETDESKAQQARWSRSQAMSARPEPNTQVRESQSLYPNWIPREAYTGISNMLKITDDKGRAYEANVKSFGTETVNGQHPVLVFKTGNGPYYMVGQKGIKVTTNLFVFYF